MESPLSNSFIPQDATTTAVSRRSLQNGGLKDLFTLLCIVLFIASAALAVGVFLYNQYLNEQSNVKSAQIQQAQANFNPALVTTIETLAQRIQSSETILSAHLAPTAFFAALDQSTVQSVSFQMLALDASDPSNITIKMDGVAGSVNAIAEQAQLFSQQGVITNPIFSDINSQADGVHFSLTAGIDPSKINYAQLIQAAQQGSSAGGNPLPQITASTTPGSVASSSPSSAPSQAPSSAQPAQQ